LGLKNSALNGLNCLKSLNFRRTVGEFLIEAKRQLCPTRWRVGKAACFVSARGDNNNNRFLSPVSLTGLNEKKTGPSRFNKDFSSVTSVTLDPMRGRQGAV
jgi:hypothetical protein